MSLSNSRFYDDEYFSSKLYMILYDYMDNPVSEEIFFLDGRYQMTAVWLYILMRLFCPIRDSMRYDMHIDCAFDDETIGGDILVNQLNYVHRHMRLAHSKCLKPLKVVVSDNQAHIRYTSCGILLNPKYAEFYRYYNITPHKPLERAISVYEDLFGKIKIPSRPMDSFMTKGMHNYFNRYSNGNGESLTVSEPDNIIGQ